MSHSFTDDIHCQLCHLEFNSGDKLPILLPNCGHTYCLACLQERVETTQMLKGKQLT